MRLVDVGEGREEVPRGEPGEIVIQSPLVMQGYWNNPEETAGQLRDGWLHTGDIAVRDEDDYFFIVDRKKDMIIAGGFNIYPREIDEVLYQHPKVQDAVAVGIPDPYRGETVKAFVVPKAGERSASEEVIDFCAAEAGRLQAAEGRRVPDGAAQVAGGQDPAQGPAGRGGRKAERIRQDHTEGEG